jgi:hypothetical protein
MSAVKPVKPVGQDTWGIIRYAPGSGSFPKDDAAAFDGWYADRKEALAVAEEWAREHSYWIVALVRSDQVWFGEGNFTNVQGPLTKRECEFAARARYATQKGHE